MFTYWKLFTTRSTRHYFAMTGIVAMALVVGGVSDGRAVWSHPERAAPQSVPDAARMASQIVAFGQNHLGQAVGDGECYDLADQALRHAHAKSAPDYGRVTEDADYVWGKPVMLRDARPGDIVQFQNFTLRTTVIGSDASQRWDTSVRDHHTSIVERNLGGTLVLLEQNVEPGLVVQRTTLPVTSGTVEGSPDGEPASATTTYDVAGVAHVYRPQPAHSLVARQ
jgi:hypothetical protein